jgi:NADH:ubiquinone oxidoreductase subunit B-like Fe-S oxidoreductase
MAEKAFKVRRGYSSLLNKPGFNSVAAISCNVHISVYADGGMYDASEISISDCNDVITIDCHMEGSSGENTLHKLDVLISNLTAFRDDLTNTYQEAQAVSEKIKATKQEEE